MWTMVGTKIIYDVYKSIFDIHMFVLTKKVSGLVFLLDFLHKFLSPWQLVFLAEGFSSPWRPGHWFLLETWLVWWQQHGAGGSGEALGRMELQIVHLYRLDSGLGDGGTYSWRLRKMPRWIKFTPPKTNILNFWTEQFGGLGRCFSFSKGVFAGSMHWKQHHYSLSIISSSLLHKVFPSILIEVENRPSRLVSFEIARFSGSWEEG